MPMEQHDCVQGHSHHLIPIKESNSMKETTRPTSKKLALESRLSMYAPPLKKLPKNSPFWKKNVASLAKQR